jgi:hypothetical protein
MADKCQPGDPSALRETTSAAKQQRIPSTRGDVDFHPTSFPGCRVRIGYGVAYEEASPRLRPPRLDGIRRSKTPRRLRQANRPPTHSLRIGGAAGGTSRRRRRQATRTAPASAAETPTAAVVRAGGTGIRSRSRTGCTNCCTSHPRSRATFSRTRSGLTTTGWPTTSSIGRSV